MYATRPCELCCKAKLGKHSRCCRKRTSSDCRCLGSYSRSCKQDLKQRNWLIGLYKVLVLLCLEHLLCLGCTRSFTTASFGRKKANKKLRTATLHLQTSASCQSQAPWNCMRTCDAFFILKLKRCTFSAIGLSERCTPLLRFY